MNIEKAITEFLRYTESYRELDHMIVLKIDHTFRVMEYCREIAESLNLSDEDIELAMYSGLLHDIGRFEQWRMYQTYHDRPTKDRPTEDHAELGVRVLQENGYIHQYIEDPEKEDLLLKTVRYHSGFQIPEDLTEREKMFCKIIRDADKIDILYLHSVKELHIDTKEDQISPEILQDLMNEKEILRERVKTKGDALAIYLGFSFDINYRKSFQILEEKKFVEIGVEEYMREAKNPQLKEQLKQIKQKLTNYIEEMCLC